ncbi:MAG TPA: hypothetical protein VFJ85_00505 [Acidimicrobiales bacterium]|nr:hypothetical protein [Acidimicrobiales bacterium]
MGLAVAVAAPATAHEDEKSTEAGVLVRQAIALMVNTPRDTMAVEDKVDDALASEKPAGVNLDLVTAAKEALAAADLHRARALLEVSIGASPHVNDMAVLPVGRTAGPPSDTAAALRLATGEESGTNVAVDALAARRHLDAGTWAVLAALAVMAGAGVALAIRFRPPVPVRALRAGTAEGRT